MGRHPSMFCLVAPERADDLAGPLAEHFAGDPAVTVLVDRRRPGSERRDGGSLGSRDQRAPVVVRDMLRTLPRELRGAPGDVRFVQRLEPVRRRFADVPMAALVDLCRDGDPDAVSELLWRFQERVRVRLRRGLPGVAIDRAATVVWGRILDELDHGAPARGAIREWIDAIVDACIDELPAGPQPP